jgi:glycosyltransferase involved in cell wall biosynthesis
MPAQRVRRELSGVTVLESDGTSGLSGARNTGLKATTQPVTVFLDDDAEVRPRCWTSRKTTPGLHGHRMDWLRSQIQVIDVMTRRGLRHRPKSKKSHRVVPVPAHILEAMSVLIVGRPRDGLVFSAPQGGLVTDGHFRNRVWYPAMEAAGIRRFAPRIMRRTAAS